MRAHIVKISRLPCTCRGKRNRANKPHERYQDNIKVLLEQYQGFIRIVLKLYWDNIEALFYGHTQIEESGYQIKFLHIKIHYVSLRVQLCPIRRVSCLVYCTLLSRVVSPSIRLDLTEALDIRSLGTRVELYLGQILVPLVGLRYDRVEATIRIRLVVCPQGRETPFP